MPVPDRFVIGIDFGTTFSAVAWASHPQDIEIITNWPTAGQLIGFSVPTEIAYPSEVGGSITWGYDIVPGIPKIKWFKLGLEEGHENLGVLNGRDAVEVTSDYLRLLHQHVMETLSRRFTAKILEHATIDYVLTVPAIWSDIAKKRTEVAARKAGLASTRFELLSEPESAAVFSLKTIENVLSTVTAGSRLVVCDAGGGTVDLISYELQKIVPVLKLVECTQGTGDFCGSSFIDREFDELCMSRMGAIYEGLSPTHRALIVKNFESSKMAFRDDAGRNMYYVPMPNTVKDDVDARIVEGNLQITRDEMRALFDPIIAQVIALIEEQVTMATTLTAKVSSILLVGGFGQSEYLYQRVQQWAAGSNIHVFQPKEASVAVVKGAVLKGLEGRVDSVIPPTMQIARKARRSYGVPTKMMFIEGQHLEEDAEFDPNTGVKLAGNQICWFIVAGDLIDDKESFCQTFRRTFQKHSPWRDVLVSSRSTDPSTRIGADVKKHCTVVSNLSHLSLKKNFDKHRRGWKTFYIAEYELVMSLRNNNLNISLQFKDQQYGVADVEFEGM